MNCKFKIYSENVEVSGDLLVITVPEYSYVEGEYYTLVIAQSIPSNAGINQVVIQYSHTQVPFLTRTGNYVRADQLKARKGYPVVYGLDPMHVSMLCFLPESCYKVIHPSYVTGVSVADEQVVEPVVATKTKAK